MEEFRRNSSNSAAFTTNRMELRRSIKKVVAPILLKLVYIYFPTKRLRRYISSL